MVQVVTGDSQEEVLIFRDKQTLHHNIYIIIIVTNPKKYAISNQDTATLPVAAAGFGLTLSSTSIPDFSSLFVSHLFYHNCYSPPLLLSNFCFLFNNNSRNCYSARGSSRHCTDTSSPPPPPHCLQQPPN